MHRTLNFFAILGLLMFVSAAPASDLKKWERFDRGGHPDYLVDNSLAMDVAWCSWHEGISLFTGSALTGTKDFRDMCFYSQRKNKASQTRIKSASDDELTAAIKEAGDYFNNKGNGGYLMVKKQLAWVMYHEGQWKAIIGYLEYGKYGRIRMSYHNYQDHNPHVAKMLSAVSDETLRHLIGEISQEHKT